MKPIKYNKNIQDIANGFGITDARERQLLDSMNDFLKEYYNPVTDIWTLSDFRLIHDFMKLPETPEEVAWVGIMIGRKLAEIDAAYKHPNYKDPTNQS